MVALVPIKTVSKKQLWLLQEKLQEAVLSRVPAGYLAGGQDETSHLQKTFKHFDINGSGDLDFNEFRKVGDGHRPVPSRPIPSRPVPSAS